MNDLSHKRELADAARDLLDDRAFTQAVLQLRKRWFDELLHLTSDPERLERVAMLKALEALPNELQTLRNDYTMAQRHG